MSLVKNNTNLYDTSVTIKRLLKTGTAVNGTTHYFRLYNQFNNKYCRLKWEVGPGESVFIKCEIEENAEGYIYGKSTGANIYVYKSGSTHKIQWRNGTTVVYEVNCDSNVHVIGWMGYVPNSTTATGRGCMPFYDGTTDSTHVVTASGYSGYATIGGAADTSDCIHSTGTWAIRVYEMQANAAYVLGETILRDFHYYAAVNTSSATQGYYVNTRYDFGLATFRTGNAVSGVTASDSVVNFDDNTPGYGVQLHDLRHIARTGYDDIIAILTEDDGLDGDAGWTTQGSGTGQAEAPCTLTKDTDIRKFAFGLSGLPRPSGWTIDNAGTQGELKLGRKPKWSIWNDSIKFGKFATDASPSKLRFNLFYKNDGTLLSKFNLENFEGYDNSSDKIHPPFFSIGDDSGNITLEMHNSVACTLDADSAIMGRQNDEQTMFKYNLASGAIGNVCLGNMPAWNYDKEELVGSSATEGMVRLAVFGGGLIFKTVGAGTVAMTLIELTDQTYTADNATWPYPLSSGSSAAVKAKFRENGFSGEAFFRDEFTNYMRYYLHTGSPAPSSLSLDAVMCMCKSMTKMPNNSQLIDCTNFAPEKRVTVSASDNPRIYSNPPTSSEIYYGDRLVVGDVGGKEKVAGTEYNLNGVWGGSRTTYYEYADVRVGTSLYSIYGKCLYSCFALSDSEGTLQAMQSNNSPLYVAFANVTICQSYSSAVNTVIKNKTRGFVPLVAKSSADYYQPFSQSAYYINNVYPINYTNVSDSNVGAAMFVWEDLLKPGNQRGSGGSAPLVDASAAVDRPSNPFTAHLRVFKKDEAPHIWNLYNPDGVTWSWSDTAENPYKTISSINYQLHVESECLLEYLNSDAVDVWMSLYSGSTRLKNTSSDTTIIKNKLVGRTVSVYSQPEYEPKQQRVTTTEFTYTIGSSTGWDSNTSFRHNIDSNWTLVIDVDDIPFWSKTMDGEVEGVGASSYVHIRAIYNGTTSNMAAKTYFINIT